MDYKKLFHKEEAFQRETFQKRMEEFGFKNMARMELFYGILNYSCIFRKY